MLKQKLVGASGLRSSEVALGTMTFGDHREWGCDAGEARRILDRFVAAGGTTVDTAPNYADGRAEEILGQYLSGRRDEIVVSTKYAASASPHPLAGGNSRRSMIQSVESSLRRLGTDRIDLLWLHFWDFTTPVDEILRAADDLVSAGKIVYFGLSDTPAWIASRAATIADLRGHAPVVAIQVEYSAATRGIEADLLPMADALDLGTFCWGPLAAGALAGGERPKRRSDDAIPAPVREVRDRLTEIAKDCGQSPRRLALRWLMQSGPCRIPILGARSADQIEQTLSEVCDPLDPEIADRVVSLAKAKGIFPGPLITSSYLRRLALGDPDRLIPPHRPRR